MHFACFRSPWSNAYDPEIEDGTVPSEELRQVEIEANTAFAQYREMYYEGGVSSVYLWPINEQKVSESFAGALLIKHQVDGSTKIKGCWDSIHLFEVEVKLISLDMIEHKQSSCLKNFNFY